MVVKAAAVALSLAAQPMIVIYGGASTLSGALSTQQSGQAIDVFAQQCGTPAPSKLMAVQTATAGAYTAVVKPLMNTAYTAKDKALSSTAVTVRVRPSLRLAKVAAHRFSLRVSAASSLATWSGSRRCSGAAPSNRAGRLQNGAFQRPRRFLGNQGRVGMPRGVPGLREWLASPDPVSSTEGVR